MASNWKLLSKIDKRTKYSVYGWIREIERELKLQHIPMMISGITILYFRGDEIFQTVGKDEILSKNDKCVKKIQGDTGFGKDNYNYGLIKIASEHDITYKWDLKINAMKEMGAVIFGFIDTKDIDAIDKCTPLKFVVAGNQLSKADNPEYCWKTINSMKLRENDILSLWLDLKNDKIEISINDEDHYIAFKNFKKDENIEYRFFVTLQEIHDSVEIVGFSTY